MRASSLAYRVVMTTGIEHGCAQARTGAASGEIPVVVSGDGLIGKVGGALAGGPVPRGVIPGGRGNDLARVAGIPDEPPARGGAGGNVRDESTSARPTRARLCIASLASIRRTRLAKEAQPSGPLVYAYAASRRWCNGSPPTRGDRRRRPPRFPGFSVAGQLGPIERTARPPRRKLERALTSSRPPGPRRAFW